MNTIKYINKKTNKTARIAVTQRIGGIGKKVTKAQADKKMLALGFVRHA